MASVREVTVLAHPTKFGKIATLRQAPIGNVRRAITDSEVLKSEVAALRERRMELEGTSLDSVRVGNGSLQETSEVWR